MTLLLLVTTAVNAAPAFPGPPLPVAAPDRSGPVVNYPLPSLVADQRREVSPTVRASRAARVAAHAGGAATTHPRAGSRPPRVRVSATPAAPPRSRPARPAGRRAPTSGGVGRVVGFAWAQLGKPYRWGAAGPRAYDCSGLVMAAYAAVGVRLPHQSGADRHHGRPVPVGQLRPGDILGYPGHVAVYVGNGRMIEAPHAGATVRVVKVRSPRWVRRIL